MTNYCNKKIFVLNMEDKYTQDSTDGDLCTYTDSTDVML